MFSRKPQSPHEMILADRDGECGDEGLLSAHAAKCPDCAAMLMTREVLRLHIEEDLPAVSAAFVQRTCSKAFETSRPSAPLWWLAVPTSWRLGFAALLVLAAAGGLAVGRSAARPAGQGGVEHLASFLAAPEVAAMRTGGVSVSAGGER